MITLEENLKKKFLQKKVDLMNNEQNIFMRINNIDFPNLGYKL
jgi:hypothetical protein